MTELRDFVLNFYRLAGGIVEPPAYGVYEVLLLEGVAARLGVEAYQRLAFDEGEGGANDDGITRLSYGHPLVEEMVETAVATPANALLHVNAVRLEKPGLADLARQTLMLANARLHQTPRQTEARLLHHYARFNFKAALITDEKHEQLVSVLMDVQNGYAVPALADLEQQAILESDNAFKNLSVAPPRWLPAPGDPLSPQVLEGLLERATRAAQEALSDPITRLTGRAARFLELDRARLTQYYDDIERDLMRRLDRSSDGSRRDSLQSKLEATRAERQIKLADVEAKYRLRVELELLNLLIITVPKLTLPVEIKHRNVGVTRTVVWNPLLHQIEPLPCDVCGQPATHLTLCSGGHLVHTDGECLLADEEQCVDCRRLFCRHCADQIKTCLVCGRPVCRHSLNRCADCGRDTCREHVGLCHAADGAPVALKPETAPLPVPPVVERPPPLEPEPQEQGKQPRLSSARRQAAERAAQRRQRQMTRHRPAPPSGPKAVKIEVYLEPEVPVVHAHVLSAGNKEIAVRSWELVDEGIGVWCQCEKGWRCPVNQTLLEPAPSDEIDRQLWGEVGALRQEYDVSPRKVRIYDVIRGMPRQASRLILRGPWKD
jgi:hypothetical protein